MIMFIMYEKCDNEEVTFEDDYYTVHADVYTYELNHNGNYLFYNGKTDVVKNMKVQIHKSIVDTDEYRSSDNYYCHNPVKNIRCLVSKDLVNLIRRVYPSGEEKPEEESEDNVNHPDHYTKGNIECIDVLVQMSNQGFDYRIINAVKYLWRYPYKNGHEDIQKAVWYLNHFLKEKDE